MVSVAGLTCSRAGAQLHALFMIDTLRAALFVFFFFQAEDGIRDVAVTGVQTCALPISARRATSPTRRTRGSRARRIRKSPRRRGPDSHRSRRWATTKWAEGWTRESRRRSEERRVGKECRSRWSPYH